MDEPESVGWEVAMLVAVLGGGGLILGEILGLLVSLFGGGGAVGGGSESLLPTLPLDPIRASTGVGVAAVLLFGAVHLIRREADDGSDW